MLLYLIESLMNESESENPDRLMFMKENFGEYMEETYWANGQIFMKHWAFDYFDGFMRWRCEGDSEFTNRVDNFYKSSFS